MGLLTVATAPYDRCSRFSLECLDLLVESFHAAVETTGDVRRLLELSQQITGDMAVVLVIDLVLEGGPEVHGHRAELHLHIGRHGTAGEEDGHFDDGVEA